MNNKLLMLGKMACTSYGHTLCFFFPNSRQKVDLNIYLLPTNKIPLMWLRAKLLPSIGYIGRYQILEVQNEKKKSN